MHSTNSARLIAIAMIFGLGACSKSADSVPPTTPAATAESSAPRDDAVSGPAGDAPSSAPSQNTASSSSPVSGTNMPDDAGPQGFSLTGAVKEKLDLEESKTMYVQLDTGTATVWVATKQIDVAAGDRVKVSDAMEMRNFASPALGRTFDVLYMASEIEKLP